VLESHAMIAETVVLASNSPRRKQLLSLFGKPFTVIPADIDESQRPGEAPRAYVRRLACEKARTVAAERAVGLVVAADTIVADGDQLLGKPEDAAAARCMLQRLRGRTHQVYTGIALMDVEMGRALDDLCQTDVPMRQYSDAEISAYIATGDPLDKAGAYAIQHAGFHPVVGLRGCFASVMGFPLCHFKRSLHQWGLETPEDLPQRCQRFIAYDCPVYRNILGDY
jgi:septum formation protein